MLTAFCSATDCPPVANKVSFGAKDELTNSTQGNDFSFIWLNKLCTCS